MVKKDPIAQHVAAIAAGEITKTNVIGMRKAINTATRLSQGWSVSRTAPAVTTEDANRLEDLLSEHKPRVTGELHESGIKQLQAKRYRRQLESVADIVTDLDHFRLVGYDCRGRHGEYAVPVYRAYSRDGKSFPFVNVPWQSGGNGPEIVSANYW